MRCRERLRFSIRDNHVALCVPRHGHTSPATKCTRRRHHIQRADPTHAEHAMYAHRHEVRERNCCTRSTGAVRSAWRELQLHGKLQGEGADMNEYLAWRYAYISSHWCTQRMRERQVTAVRRGIPTEQPPSCSGTQRARVTDVRYTQTRARHVMKTSEPRAVNIGIYIYI